MMAGASVRIVIKNNIWIASAELSLPASLENSNVSFGKGCAQTGSATKTPSKNTRQIKAIFKIFISRIMRLFFHPYIEYLFKTSVRNIPFRQEVIPRVFIQLVHGYIQQDGHLFITQTQNQYVIQNTYNAY